MLQDRQQALENIREQVVERLNNLRNTREEQYNWVKKQSNVYEIKKGTEMWQKQYRIRQYKY